MRMDELQTMPMPVPSGLIVGCPAAHVPQPAWIAIPASARRGRVPPHRLGRPRLSWLPGVLVRLVLAILLAFPFGSHAALPGSVSGAGGSLETSPEGADLPEDPASQAPGKAPGLALDLSPRRSRLVGVMPTTPGAWVAPPGPSEGSPIRSDRGPGHVVLAFGRALRCWIGSLTC